MWTFTVSSPIGDDFESIICTSAINCKENEIAPTLGRDSEIAPTFRIWNNKVLLYFVAQSV